MKIHIHPINSWLWLSNQDNRLKYLEFRRLVNHLKLKFQFKLLRHEDQPVYTYHTDQVSLNNEVEKFISQHL